MNLQIYTTSWKTTAAAIAAVVALLAEAVVVMLDGDPATNPDWNVIVPAIILAVGMIFSRDADKSSEASGVR